MAQRRPGSHKKAVSMGERRYQGPMRDHRTNDQMRQTLIQMHVVGSCVRVFGGTWWEIDITLILQEEDSKLPAYEHLVY